MARCRHAVKSPEGYLVEVDVDDEPIEKPVTVWLCNWADSHPERLVDAPRWVLQQVVHGAAVLPHIDCVKCPAFAPASRQGE